MKKTQPEDSEPKRGWPSKKVMAGRSGEVFSLDFLFIEQAHAAEAANQSTTPLPSVISSNHASHKTVM
jgi:hypothetical protein